MLVMGLAALNQEKIGIVGRSLATSIELSQRSLHKDAVNKKTA